MNKYFSSSAITNFKYIVQTENIKLLHIHSMEAGWGGHLAAKLAGLKPVVFTPQTTSFTKKWLKSIYYNIWRLYGNWTSKLIAVSTQQEAEMWQYRFVNKREKIITIYNGVNITQLEKLIKEKDRENNEIIKMLGVNTDAPIIGYMGRFSWQKDPFNFVKAAKIVLEKYPKVQFVMVGNGILKENTITLIKELAISKQFFLPGKLAYNQAMKSLSLFNMLVLASRWEGLSYTLLEAMALKRPIVASRITGNTEAIKGNETGLLVHQENPLELAEAIMYLLDNPQKANELGENAYNWVKEDFSLEAMINKLEKCYLELIKS